ncbi:hypothetical protein QR90_14430 [Deinococcus radiopugnans]|uniref:Uncharacterized protein n=1 Tax=Deinococcus radiopugnans TaxID=57497 RepID=A0A0A7KIN7_9DEIO|nr:hypothetical protein [Deinococcus radiopugnans]AIZ46006.1 hypothetical protein QR90_14430 [Deinococcus radiopugnans]QLG11865.1 hypothetical protein HLB42_14565 [Deinococcus sp. D7000]
MPAREFLERRNALWQRLRDLSAEEGWPDSPEFGMALQELCDLIGWDRQRVLAGLGLDETPVQEDRP